MAVTDGIFGEGTFGNAKFGMLTADSEAAAKVYTDIQNLFQNEIMGNRRVQLFKATQQTDDKGYLTGTTLSTTADETYDAAVRYIREQDVENYPVGHVEAGDVELNIFLGGVTNQPEEFDYLQIDGINFEITQIVARPQVFGGVPFMKVLGSRRDDAER